MNKEKMQLVNKLFNNETIRTVWDSEKEDYYFSVVDVIAALTNANIPRNYWSDLKRKLLSEGSELHENIVQLKMKSKKDGKSYLTDALDTKGILRLIESVPSPKAEPFKIWLANLGSERIDEVFDPSIAVQRAIDLYRKKGYDEAWIAKRIKALQDRKQLTDVWKENGIVEDKEYAILTNEIYKTWSGMTAKEYKEYKGLRKESLRDNMDSLEISLTDISEEVTKRLAQKNKPKGLKENIKVAHKGGQVAKKTRIEIENLLEESIVTKNNKLNYEYMDEKLLEEKD